MRSIVVPLELTVRLVEDATAVELLIVLNLAFWLGWWRRAAHAKKYADLGSFCVARNSRVDARVV
jgi:hypothetical protein